MTLLQDMTVERIIRFFLILHGYDGLCYDDCGCSVDDLMPCKSYSGLCRPAYRHTAEYCKTCEGRDKCGIADDDYFDGFCEQPKEADNAAE